MGIKAIVGAALGVSVDAGARVGMALAVAVAVAVAVGVPPKISGPSRHAMSKNGKLMNNHLIFIAVSLRLMYCVVYPLSVCQAVCCDADWIHRQIQGRKTVRPLVER